MTIRFGLMWHGGPLKRWEADCLRRILSLPNPPELALVIEDLNPRFAPPPPKRNFFQRLRHADWGALFYNRYCQHLFRPSALETDPSSVKLLDGVPVIGCRTTKKGKWSEYFSAEDVSAIREKDLDFILRFGFDIIRGDILTSARHGVWSFHHGDEQNYRGMPPGFWELYHADPVTGSILQKLNDRLDGGVVLKRGTFKTLPWSYPDNLSQALLESAKWPAQVCADLQNGNAPYLNDPASPSTALIYRRPTNLQMGRFALRMLGNKLRQKWREWFQSEIWSIGVVKAPIESFLDPNFNPKIEFIPNPSNDRWLADPFGVRKDGKLHILCEEFSMKKNIGTLSCLSVGDRIERKSSGIESPFHFSYPYLFQHAGEIYCIPECYQSKQIALYRAVNFPHEWRKETVLVDQITGLDATVFQHEGQWWMTATQESEGDNLSLFAWYADNLRGPWTPHAGNPIKTDIRSARPAGTPFVKDGILYRPAQNCARTYGGGVVINRVLELTPTRFREEAVVAVDPIKGTPFADGLHTLSAVGDWTLIDGKRFSKRKKARMAPRPFANFRTITDAVTGRTLVYSRSTS